MHNLYIVAFILQLKLYATRTSFTSPISDSYDSVSGSVISLKEWHDDNSRNSKFIFSNFICFPAVTIVLVISAVIYFNSYAPNHRMEKIKEIIEENDTNKIDYLDWNLQNIFFMSSIFTLYTLALSCAGFQSEIDKHVIKETSKLNTTSVQSRLIASLPIVTFSIDLVICIIMIGGCICVCIRHTQVSNNQCKNWCQAIQVSILYCLTLALAVLLIVIPSVTPLNEETSVAIKSPNTSALSILGILMLMVMLILITFKTAASEDRYLCSLHRYYYSYSIIFPLCCIANHLNYIIIAFVLNPYSATNVAVVYGVVILSIYGVLQQVSYLLGKNLSAYQLLLKPIIVIFLSGYVVFDILLYFFLPIDNAFDNAANHFISIYQTVVFFTAIAAYFLVTGPFKSPFSLLTKAEFKDHVLFDDETEKKEEFDKATDNGRDLLIAKEVLSIMKALKPPEKNRKHNVLYRLQRIEENSIRQSEEEI